MDENLLVKFGDLTLDARHGYENIDFKITSSMLNESYIKDSTKIYEETLGRENSSNCVSNKETNQKRFTDFCRAKISSASHTNETNSKCELSAIDLYKHNVPKLDFSSSYKIRNYKGTSAFDLDFGNAWDSKSDFRTMDFHKESFSDKDLNESGLISTHTNNGKGYLSKVTRQSNLNSCVESKSIKKSNINFCKQTMSPKIEQLQKYPNMVILPKFERHKHCIPSFDLLNSREGPDDERISVFDISFPSKDEFESDLRLEEFQIKKITAENLNKSAFYTKKVDYRLSNQITDVNKKCFSRNFDLLNFPSISKKLKEIERKLIVERTIEEEK